jgi:DNA-binding NtrC family response regulator
MGLDAKSVLHRTLVVSNKTTIRELAERISREVLVADDLAEAFDIARTAKPDLVVFDGRTPPVHVQEFHNTTDKSLLDIPVVVIGNGENDMGTSEEFTQAGACDYLRGEQDCGRLEQIADRIRDNHNTTAAQEDMGSFFLDDFAASIPIAGQSKAIHNKLRMIRLVAGSQCDPILVVGETGTGKELAAKAIHIARHANEEFVAVNCAALTANLLESELFGHVKGSFTGADRDKIGLLELAGSGTIFLDEISEMPLDLQAKLLRVLQEKTFRKVGGVKDITCNATIIASSNRNLKNEVQANRFRRDLYYRLSVCPITIAPLRSPERREDIRLLAEYFLRTSTICLEKRSRITSLTNLAAEALERHDWPGNARELRNVIERAILLETTNKIGLASIVIDPAECEPLPESAVTTPIKDFSLAKAERELIARALQETGWQKTHAASLLGITRATLYAKVKQYHIEKASPAAGEPRRRDATHDNTETSLRNGPKASSTPEAVSVA